ncbi:MAG: hypothetical protein VX527_08240 [Planctomycetota bacterium]|nr:hypothetical protein [Planctomycetota bacterium]
MNRLLRKYSKLLLAIFGTGLMIVFLMPQIPDLVSRFGAGTTLVATLGRNGTKINTRDWNEVRNELQFLDKFQAGLPPLPLIGRIETAHQYYLLVHEASEAGMIGGVVTAGVSDTDLLQISRNSGFPPAVVRQALTNRAGIYRYLVHVVNSGQHSDRRLKGEGRRHFDAADAQVVALKADRPTNAKQPDQQAIQTQYETYRDVEPGEGDHGFGYRLPNRLSMEWLTIPQESIDESIRTSDAMSDRELMKFWRRNEVQFPGFEDSDEIPETVRTAMLNELRDGQVDAVIRTINDRLRMPRRGFDELGGYLVLPEDWSTKQTSLEEIRELIATEFNIDIEPSATTGDTLVEIDTLAELDGIGRARSDKFSRLPVALQELVEEAKEFNGQGLYPIQATIAGPILKDTTGNLYVFRITEADGARPPKDLEEVNDEVVADLQRLAHYEELLTQLDDIEQVTKTEGLETLAGRWETDAPASRSFQKYQPGTVAFYVQQGLRPEPAPALLPGLANEDPAVVNAILSQASDIDVDTTINDLDEADRVMVLPSDQNLAIIAVRLIDRRSLDRDAFQQMAVQRVIPMLLLNEELGGDITPLQDAFSSESLQDRHDFRFAGNDDADNANASDVPDAAQAAVSN